MAHDIIADTSSQDRLIGNGGRGKKRLAGWITGTLVLVCLLSIGLYIGGISSSDLVVKRSSIRTAVVQRGDFIREVLSQGRIIAASSPTVFSPEQGYVDLFVKAGDTVTLGQPLAIVTSSSLNELKAREVVNFTKMEADLGRAEIDSKRRKLELGQSLALAKVSLNEMIRERKRAAAAIKLHLISRIEFEKAEDDLDRARLEFEQAKQNSELGTESLDFEIESLRLQLKNQQLLVGALERRLGELQIKSPVEGMVGNVQVIRGQAVAASQPLITVVDLTAFEVEAVVPEGFADELAPLMDAEIQLHGQTYSGQLTGISPEVLDGGVVTRVRFTQALPLNLRQSQRVTVRILLESKPDTLIVDRGSFFEGFRGEVYKVKDENAVRVPVVLGGTSLRHVEILEGLNKGDEIIISNLVVKSSDQQILLTK